MISFFLFCCWCFRYESYPEISRKIPGNFLGILRNSQEILGIKLFPEMCSPICADPTASPPTLEMSGTSPGNVPRKSQESQEILGNPRKSYEISGNRRKSQEILGNRKKSQEMQAGIVPGNFRNCPGNVLKCHGDVWELSWRFPEVSREIPRNAPGHFPGHVRELSGKCPEASYEHRKLLYTTANRQL